MSGEKNEQKKTAPIPSVISNELHGVRKPMRNEGEKKNDEGGLVIRVGFDGEKGRYTYIYIYIMEEMEGKTIRNFGDKGTTFHGRDN